jgi:uncharacterized protein with GYD domain
MPKFVVLVNWTEQGVQAANETTKRAEQARQLAEQMGGRVEQLLWTLGRYDLVGVYDMPNDEAMAALAMKVASGGSVRTECLRAFTADEVDGIITGLG